MQLNWEQLTENKGPEQGYLSSGHIWPCAMCLESPLKIVPSDPLTRGRADIVEMLGFGEDEGSIENGPNQQQ